MTGATYWCKKQTAIVLVSDRQRNAASQKLSSPMILALYFIHVWTGVLGVGIHDSRAGGGSRTAGEEVQGEEQEQAGGANDQPKPHCPCGELAV